MFVLLCFSFPTSIFYHCLMIFHVLGIPFSSMKLVSIFIDFGMDVGLTFDVFFDTFSIRVRNVLNLQNHCFYYEFQWFDSLEKYDFWWCSWSFSTHVVALIFDEFWHRFRLHFGNLLASIFIFWGDRFNWLFIIFFIKMAPKSRECITPFSVLFRDLFPHTSTFYNGKTYKCQKPCFPTFFKQLKECIRTCTFNPGKTYKCAVTVFTIIKK